MNSKLLYFCKINVREKVGANRIFNLKNDLRPTLFLFFSPWPLLHQWDLVAFLRFHCNLLKPWRKIWISGNMKGIQLLKCCRLFVFHVECGLLWFSDVSGCGCFLINLTNIFKFCLMSKVYSIELFATLEQANIYIGYALFMLCITFIFLIFLMHVYFLQFINSIWLGNLKWLTSN